VSLPDYSQTGSLPLCSTSQRNGPEQATCHWQAALFHHREAQEGDRVCRMKEEVRVFLLLSLCSRQCLGYRCIAYMVAVPTGQPSIGRTTLIAIWQGNPGSVISRSSAPCTFSRASGSVRTAK
jgi:hypothetical protein